MSELEARISLLEINLLRAQAELAQAKLDAATAHLPRLCTPGSFSALAREINSRRETPRAGEPMVFCSLSTGLPVVLQAPASPTRQPCLGSSSGRGGKRVSEAG